MKPYLEGSLPCHINTWKRPICFLIDSLDGEVKMMISFTGSYVALNSREDAYLSIQKPGSAKIIIEALHISNFMSI